MKSRHVPIKALLLDQATLSGIGNWVGDEVLYQAKLHPEQYCDEFNDKQVGELYRAIHYVCQLAVDKLGDSDEFPEDWMFHYRWDNRPSAPTSHLPNGEKLAFLKVGGRTSCYAPNVQKKSGHVPSGIKEEPVVSDAETEAKPKSKGKAKASKGRPEAQGGKEGQGSKQPDSKKRKIEATAIPEGRAKGSKASRKQEAVKNPSVTADGGRRRSGRLRGAAA